MSTQLTRRQFLIAAGTVSAMPLVFGAPAVLRPAVPVPRRWYDGVRRWGLTNISEKCVLDYDVAFWREQWKRTEIQALIANGVSAIAMYPTRNPYVETSRFAPTRDLLGEIAAAAQSDGIHVVARLETGSVPAKAREAYADWRVVNANGQRGNGMCINSPFRATFLYDLMREMVERYRVVGFIDNTGFGPGQLCYCPFCTSKWEKELGGPLPRATSLDDPLYRRWRRWANGVSVQVWGQTNDFLRGIAGPDVAYLAYDRKFTTNSRDIVEICPLTLMDCQSRNDSFSYREHADEGRYLRSMSGWTKDVAACSAMYQHSHGYFRLTADPAVEARMYQRAALAGGFNPYWHHAIAYTADKRQYEISPPVFQWHKRHEADFGGVPVAIAGVVRSEDNAIFSAAGGGAGAGRGGGRGGGGAAAPGGGGGSGLGGNATVEMPYRGMLSALFDTRTPFYPIHVKDVTRHGPNLRVLIYPNIGVMSDAECGEARRYVRDGGSILVTGMTSLYDDEGQPRRDFGLADVLGVNLDGPVPSRQIFNQPSISSYLRLSEPGSRHAALSGFEKVRAVPYGGAAVPLKVAPGRQVLATYAVTGPDGGLEPRTEPCVIVGEYGKGRVAFVPADLDRRHFVGAQSAYATLLGNLVKWCARDYSPLEVKGPGYVGAYLYRKEDRTVLHLFNGTGVDNGNEMSDRTHPTGPLQVRVRVPAGTKGTVRLLAAERTIPARLQGGVLQFTLDSLDDYEVAVLE